MCHVRVQRWGEGKVQVSPSGLRFKIADDSKISNQEESKMTNFGSFWDIKNVLEGSTIDLNDIRVQLD